MGALIHGENGFKPVAELPQGKTRKYTIYIARHSETGHHHVLESEVEFEVVEDALKNIYIQLFAPAKVVHKKTFDIHETKTLEPGIYQITHKTGYDPFNRVVREVWD